MQDLIASLQTQLGVSGTWFTILVMVVFALLITVVMAVNSIVLVWLERKVSAWMQDRLGPMEVGPFQGVLQTVADAVKLLLKEDIVPKAADKKLHLLSPLIVFAAPCAAFAAFSYTRDFRMADFNIGIFYVAAITSLSVIGILLSGWASNNKWALLGGMRAAAQIVSYEIPAGLSMLVIIMQVGSLSFHEITLAQDGGFWNWFVFQYPPFNFIAFLIFFTATLAECNRTPFDLPEAESELVAGFHTEYSGFKWSIFMMSEYGEMLVVSIVVATLFLGGWSSPFGDFLNTGAWGLVWLSTKIFVLIFVQMWLRWTLPRLRVDQLMYTSWKVLTPFAFVCLFAVGLWMLI